MSFFEGLCVNEENETCTIEKHYYDNSSHMKPYILHSTGKAIPLAMYIDMVGDMVKSHNDISEYGKWLGVSFLNRTYNSMLDCYPRLNMHCERQSQTNNILGKANELRCKSFSGTNETIFCAIY